MCDTYIYIHIYIIHTDAYICFIYMCAFYVSWFPDSVKWIANGYSGYSYKVGEVVLHPGQEMTRANHGSSFMCGMHWFLHFL